MGCCGCSSRATSIFAAIYSLIQASAWIGLSIYGLEVYNCHVPVNYGTPSFDIGNAITAIANLVFSVITITYFYNPECNFTRIGIDWTEFIPPGTDQDVIDNITNTITWDPLVQPAAERTYAFMQAYTILSALWIGASILLLIIAVGNKKGKVIAALHYPWILTMAAILVTDVVATVLYCLDIPKTMGLVNVLTFMGLKGLDIASNYGLEIPTGNEFATAAPTIVMAVFLSRFVIFWIMNLVLFVYVFSSAVKIGRQKPGTQTGWKKIENPNASQTSGSDNWHLPSQELTPPRPIQPSQAEPYQQQQQQQRSQAPTHFNYTQHPEPQRVVQSPMQSFSPAKYPPNNTSQYALPNVALDNRPSSSHVNPAYQYDEELPTYRPEPNKKPKPLPKSYEPRFSGTEYPGRQSYLQQPSAPGPQRNDSKTAPTELRSQLPWSYFQPRDDPVNVRHQQVHENDEDLPPIPVPDYTLHFPRRPR